MRAFRLIQALCYIQQNDMQVALGATVTAIEFEDGSGNKFNYTIYSAILGKEQKFIDLTGKL